jgi:peptidoglycan/xylan/chitin deacetylase (PgdA/CDA1 family)
VEIVDSRTEIAASVGAPVDLFCYPNGDSTPAARELVSQHYVGAVTTEKGWHSTRADPYQIRRIGVHEHISNRPASFLARLSGWL